MNNFIEFVVDIFSGIFTAVKKLSVKYGVVPVGTFLIAMWGSIFMASVLFGAFWLAGSKTGVIVLGISFGLIFLMGFKTGKLYAKIIAHITYTIFRSDRWARVAYGELTGLVAPAQFISLLFSFLAAVAALKPLNSMSIESLMLWSAVAVFFYIVSHYFAGKTLAAQIIMIGVVVFLLITNYLFPIQSKAVINWAERKTIGSSHNVNLTDKEGDLILIKSGSRVFSDEDMNKHENTEQDIKAKILDVIEDEKSGEQVYEVIFPISDGFYVGGKVYYIPVRTTENLKPKEEVKVETKQINNQQTESQPQMLDETIIGKVGDKGKAYFSADQPFEIKERTEDGFISIPMPSGKSSRYFEWGGNIRIIGKRNDVKLIKVTY